MSTERISWNVGKNAVTIKADGQTYTIKDTGKDGKISQSEINAALKGKDGRAMSSRLRSLFIQLGKSSDSDGRSLDDIQSKFKAISTDSNSLEAIDKQIAKETRLKKEKMAELRNKRTQLSNAIKTYNHVKAQFLQQQKREAMMQRQMQSAMMSPMNMMAMGGIMGSFMPQFPGVVQGFNMPGMQGSMMMGGYPTMASVGITEDELNEIGEAINEEVDKFKDELSEAGIDEDDLKTGDFEKIKIDVKEENKFEFVQEGKDRKAPGSTASSIDDYEGLSKEEIAAIKKQDEEDMKFAREQAKTTYNEEIKRINDDEGMSREDKVAARRKALREYQVELKRIKDGDFGSEEDDYNVDSNDEILAQQKRDFDKSKKTRTEEKRKKLKELEAEYKKADTEEARKKVIENEAQKLRQDIKDIQAENFDPSTTNDKKKKADDLQFEATQIASRLNTQIKASWFDGDIADKEIAKVTKDNILEVLNAYGEIKGKQGRDLFDGFVREWMFKSDKKGYLAPIKNALVERIKEKGYYDACKDKIAELENAWESEYEGFHPLWCDEAKVANAFNELYEFYKSPQCKKTE